MADRLVDESSGRIIAHDVRWARTLAERSKGLIGSPPLTAGQALIIEPGTQVHTFRMGYPIDVVFAGRDWKVRHVVRDMRPRRMSKLVFGSRFVIELASGSLPEDVRRGTRLKLVS
jgi:uncharacterized protein